MTAAQLGAAYVAGFLSCVGAQALFVACLVFPELRRFFGWRR